MTELAKQVARAAGELEPTWTEERSARLLASIKARQQGRVRRNAVLRGLAVIVVILLAAAGVRGRSALFSVETVARKPAPPVFSEPPLGERRDVSLSDGSLARAEDAGSQLLVREQQPSRTVVSLVRGRASFAVVKNPQRLFRVESGPVAVEVLGTRFSVERLGPEGVPGAQTRVTVSEGRVRVLWAAHYAELTAGQSALFPPDPVSPIPTPPPAAVSEPPAAVESAVPLATPEPSGLAAPPPHRVGLRRPGGLAELKKPAEAAAESPRAAHPVETKARPSWKELAQDGQFDRAYGEAYGVEPGSEARERPEGPLRTVEKSPGDLLLLADVARLSHHPADAVAPLERLLRVYEKDPRAPLAAFTLGRVLLDELGRPREAAETFARAQQLDPEGPLYQDALAREVEAWSRAGESERARLRAEEYIRRYPKGRRLRSVRRYGEPD